MTKKSMKNDERAFKHPLNSSHNGSNSITVLSKPAGSYRHGDLRNALLVAASELINKRGGPQITLREIAVMTGVRHAAVYRHFSSKEALLAVVAENRVAALAAHLQAAVSKPVSMTQTGHENTSVFALAEAYLAFAHANKGDYQVMAGDNQSRRKQMLPVIEILQTSIEEAAAQGMCRSDVSPERLARQFFAQLHGMALIALDFSTDQDGPADDQVPAVNIGFAIRFLEPVTAAPDVRHHTSGHNV